MNPLHRDVLFFMMVFSLTFNCIPSSIQMNFLAGPMGSQLIFYPAFVSLCYTFYCQVKKGNILVRFDKFKIFLVGYVTVMLISLVNGLYIYPYYNLILYGPIDQVEKIPKLLAILNECGINVSARELLSFWMMARPIKGLIFEVTYTFGISYIIYCWYHNDWRQAIKILTKGIMASVTICIVYSSIELFYLVGNDTASVILKKINPYIHLIKTRGTWWPPLLWEGQLRSVFAEPSYFGMYTAFCLPFLWGQIFSNKFKFSGSIKSIVLVLAMSFLLFITKARTGFMLHIGEIFILSIVLWFVHNKTYIKKFLIILLCSCIAFLGCNFFISNCMENKKNDKVKSSVVSSMESYVDSNAVSLINPDKRSNRARYSVMEADLRIGIDNPILGIGRGLRNAYVINYFTESALKNREVQMWLRFSKKQGILKAGIPTLGEYTSRFSETGLLGIVLFLFPPFLLLFNMLRKIRCLNMNTQVYYIMYITSLIGIMAAGIGDGINILWCYWLILGVGYAMCYGKQDEEVTNG